MIKFYFSSLSCLGLLVASCIASKEPFIIPKHFPKPVYPVEKNVLTTSKIELGRALFYDPILSKDSTISCNSCHSQYNAFAHVDHPLSHGIQDQIGTRNAPALMNLAWHNTFMWDGAINHLDMQSLFPITQPNEMNESIENVIRKLQRHKFYPGLFATAYSEKGITGEKTLKAISAFMLTLVSANSRYDSVMRKQSNFTNQEWNGYNLFKKYCNSCHQEPLFTNFEFENNGLPIDPSLNDYGRMNVSHNSNDSMKFKIPTLRNIEFTYPYMHDGRFKKLQDVLHHYTTGIRPEGTVSKKLENPIVLSSNEKVDLLSFLLCLTDKEFLFQKNHSYPRHIFQP